MNVIISRKCHESILFIHSKVPSLYDVVVSIGNDDSKPWGDFEVRVYLSDMTSGYTIYEYLGIDVIVNLDPDIEAPVAWTPIHTGAGILTIHCSIPYIASLVTAICIMKPTTN